jgi:hypothetical protein
VCLSDGSIMLQKGKVSFVLHHALVTYRGHGCEAPCILDGKFQIMPIVPQFVPCQNYFVFSRKLAPDVSMSLVDSNERYLPWFHVLFYAGQRKSCTNFILLQHYERQGHGSQKASSEYLHVSGKPRDSITP